MRELLVRHNVVFDRQKSYNGKFRCTAKGGGLANFLDDYTDPDSIDEALENINYYLNGGVFNYEKNTVSSEVFTAWIDNSSVDIYYNGNENILQTIPLKDFKAILVAWRDFLLQFHLDDTRKK